MRRWKWILALLLLAAGTLVVWWRWPRIPPRQVWVYEGEGVIRQPPLVSDALVLSAASGAPLTALDLHSGAVRWTFRGEQGVWERSLAVDGVMAWIGVRGGGLAALHLPDGRVLWQQSLPGEVMVPPRVLGEVLYVPVSAALPDGSLQPESQASLVALNRADGSVRWQTTLDAYALQTPWADAQGVWVGGSAYDPTADIEEGGVTALFALDAHNGAVRWQRRTLDGFPKSLAVEGGVLVMLAYQDVVRALDARTGEQIWQRDTGNWTPAFTLADGTLYFGSANTKVHALDVRTGAVRWQFDIPQGSFNYVLDAPAVARGRVFFLTQRGDLMALRAADGRLLWHLPTDIPAAVGVRAAPPWLVVGDMQGDVYLFRLPGW